MSRATRYGYLIRMGFLPSEAKSLSHTSRLGLQSPYMQRFIRSRRALNLNKIQYGWSESDYREVIRRQYAERGCFKQDILGRLRADVWQMLRWYEERTPKPKDEYEPPWKKKIKKRSMDRRVFKTSSRKELMRSWIQQLNLQIDNAGVTPEKRARLTKQRDNLQKQLGKLA